jgi:O-methyltransferase
MKLGQKLVRGTKSMLRAIGAYGDDKSEDEGWAHPLAPDIRHSRIAPAATYSPWLTDSAFLAAYRHVRKSTLVDIYRCYELWELARQSSHVEGAILEVGVWRGGTGCLLALAAPQKTVYLADTFEGVVNAGPRDTRYSGGEHADTSDKIALKLLTSARAANAQLLKGTFPRDTAAAITGTIALLHVDVDVYQSARDAVEWALPRLMPGSIIVFDDYGFYGCEGITRCVQELRDQLHEFAFIHNLNGHAVFVKLADPPPRRFVAATGTLESLPRKL